MTEKKTYTVSDGEYTFILEDTSIDGVLKTTEVIGFYFGEEDDELTEEYAHKGVIARFN